MNKRVFYRSKIFVVGVVLAVVFIALYLFYNSRKYGFVNKQVNKMLTEKTSGLYNVSYDSIHLDELGGDLYLKNVHLVPDTLRQLELIKNNDTAAVPMLFDVLIPEIRVVDFTTARALLGKELQCHKIEIISPVINLYLFPGQKEPKDKDKQKQALYKQILGNLNQIKADSVLIKNATASAIDFNSKAQKFRTFNTSLIMGDLLIDSTYNSDTSRTMFCKAIFFHTDKAEFGNKGTSASATNVTYNTNQNVFFAASMEYDAFKSGGFVKTELRGIALRGLELKGPLDKSSLKVGGVELEECIVETKQAESKQQENSAPSKAILDGWIKEFAINNFSVKKINFSKITDNKSSNITVANSSVRIKEFYIDSTATLDETLVTKAKDLELLNDEIKFTSEDKLYNYVFSGIRFNSSIKKLVCKQVAIKPSLGEVAFANHSRVQKDRFEAGFKNIVCSNIEVEKLVKGEFIVKDVVAGDSYLNVYRDISKPPDSINKIGKYPHQMLKKLKTPLQIDKLTATNLTVEYKEKNGRSDTSGRVRFVNSSMIATNISNRNIKKGDKCILNFSSRFLNQIPIKGAFTFYLDEAESGKFEVEGTVLKSFEGNVLNAILMPMSLARIDKGVFNTWSFKFTGTNNNASGNLSLNYKDLKLSLLRKNNSTAKPYNKKNVLSLLVNLFVKDAAKKAADRTVSVKVERDPYRSFFYLCWQAIFTGAKDIMTLKI